jgi:CRISPR-associated endonuclease/helicase Cas3
MSSALEHMWAKSDTSDGREPSPLRHSVLAHLLDSASVAAVIWHRWLSEGCKTRLDALCVNSSISGIDILQVLAGVHDIGKISPAFQSKQPELNNALANLTGAHLNTCADDADAKDWRHTLAGGAAIATLLKDTPWAGHAGWMAAVIGGHHGLYPDEDDYRVTIMRKTTQGTGEWDAVRQEALTTLLHELKILGPDGGLESLPPFYAPTPADQVILTGVVIMAD